MKEYFPKWNPHYATWIKINSLDYKTRIKALRNSSSGFIKNIHVKKAIRSKCNNECVNCGSKDGLQIDHIVSVYLANKHRHLLDGLNTFENLQLLCKGCNSSKSPEGI